MLAAAQNSLAKQSVYARVQVATPYIELHTGPGRGFPVFHVVKKGEWFDVLKRRTDWFKVRTQKGKTGWVSRAQMENTITEMGEKSKFRDNFLKEYLGSRLEFGSEGGYFDGDPLMITHMGLRLNKNLTTELSYAQVSGTFSTFQLAYLSLSAYPWDDTRFSPFFSVGVGSFRNVPKGTLVSAFETNSVAGNVGLGIRFYITRNFVFRTEYRYYNAVVDDTISDRYPAWAAGFSFFF